MYQTCIIVFSVVVSEAISFFCIWNFRLCLVPCPERKKKHYVKCRVSILPILKVSHATVNIRLAHNTLVVSEKIFIYLLRMLKRMQWTPQTSATNLQLMYYGWSKPVCFQHIHKVIYYTDNLILLFQTHLWLQCSRDEKNYSSRSVLQNCNYLVSLLCINKSSSCYKKDLLEK